jgi:hypothetical protein
MKIANRENFRFRDGRIALGLFFTAPWLILIATGVIAPTGTDPGC